MNSGPADIAIIGMACIFPKAPDVETFWRNIVDGVDAITDAPPNRMDPLFYDPMAHTLDRVPVNRGGFIDDFAEFDPLPHGIMPIAAEGAEPDQLLALRVATDALRDAGYEERPFPRETTSVILGRGNYPGAGMLRYTSHVRVAEQLVLTLKHLIPGISEETLQAVKAEYQAQCNASGPDNVIGLVPNLTASRIANRLDLGGAAFTVDAACASSLFAVEHACRALRDGGSDIVLAGGVHLCQEAAFWSVFAQLGALSRSAQIRPFSAEADGLLMGEGLGMVVLKRLRDAERDNDRIYAVIKGIGQSSDGRDRSLMTPRVEGQLLALERAWEQAGLDRSRTNLIEAHGTATQAGDQAELTTLARFFGPLSDSGERAGLGSVKSMIGHAMPAAGIAGLIKATLAVYHGVLPPSLHCESPNPLLDQTRFRVLAKSERWPEEDRVAGINAFGFGGANAHVVLQSHAENKTARRSFLTSKKPVPAVKAFFAAAETPEALIAAIESGNSGGNGTCRIAVLDPTPERMSEAEAAVSRGRPRSGRDGIYFAPKGLIASGGKVAFMFPGVEARFEPQMDDVLDAFGLEMPEVEVEGVEGHGASVFILNKLLFDVAETLEMKPDALIGHSVGEWSAMLAAGILQKEDVIQLLSRGEEVSVEFPDVVYLAVGTGAERAAAVIHNLPGISVSHDNCDHQSILCGPAAAIDIAFERFRKERVLCEVLPFRSGFHSPALAGVVDEHVSNLETMTLGKPTISIRSATTLAEYPQDHADVKALFRRHLLEPVRFRELITALYDEGFRFFIQVGTGALAAFVDDTLASKPHVAISMNVPQRSGMEQLARAALAYYVEGGEVRLDKIGLRAPEPFKESRAMKLSLGVPLISVSVPPLQITPGEELADLEEATPVLESFGAAMKELALAQSVVAQAYRQLPRLEAAAPAPPPWRPAELNEELELSLATYPELIDHSLFPQPPDWPNPIDRRPVVPLTMSIELMKEAAQRLQPGRVVVAMENIKAFTWLMVEPPARVQLKARELDRDRILVELGANASAEVVMADKAMPSPASAIEPVEDVLETGVTADLIYKDRWLFHGPAYQGITDLQAMGSNGADAAMTSLPAKGALLDAAGQLLGLWVMLKFEIDRLAMPVRVKRIEFYGDWPAVGDTVNCSCRLLGLGRREVRAKFEASSGGRVFIRIDGWEDWRFPTTPDLFWVMQFPEQHLLSERLPDGVVVLPDPGWIDSTMDFLAGRFLSAEEIERANLYRRENRRRDWLLGRIAAKDAVRRIYFDRGQKQLYPVEIGIVSEDSGRPRVVGPYAANLEVSISHTEGIAAAIVAEGVMPGIDVEKVEPRGETFLDIAFAAEERKLLGPDPDDEMVTRLWCAKEAVGKALGTGLGGAPKDFVLQQIDGDRLLVRDRWVRTHRRGDFIVAWTQQ